MRIAGHHKAGRGDTWASPRTWLPAPHPGFLGRLWHLHLYPLDAPPPPPSPPVCTVPLVESPAQAGVFPVEVQGVPRPHANVVVVRAGDTVLWPAGRALLWASRAPVTEGGAGWWWYTGGASL